LWVAATRSQESFRKPAPSGDQPPKKRCGKSRRLDVIETLVHRPLIAFNASVAALFRCNHPDDPPTLLLDEADTVWSKQKTGAAEDLRALINTGVT